MFNIGLTITGVFVSLTLIIFSTFFSARLAQLKGRSSAWGFLGFLLNIIGLIIVCFLPSKRNDSINTNPIKHLTSKIPVPSKNTMYVFIAIIGVIVITLIAYDKVPQIIENQNYLKQVTETNDSSVNDFSLIEGNVQSIFLTDESTYMITDNGDGYCFGKNHPLKTEEPTENKIIYKDAQKILSNDKECFVLCKNGELYSYSPENEQQKLISDDVRDFSVSEYTVGIIKNDNTLYMYGNNAYGQLGTGSEENSEQPVKIIKNVQSVHCEATFTVALKTSGEVVAFGSNAFGQFGKEGKTFSSPTVISKNIKKVSVGDDYIMLLDKKGKLSVCGNNDCGQLGNSSYEKASEFTEILTGIADIASAKKSSFALSENGELYSFGQNSVGQLGLGSIADTNVPTVCAQNVAKVETSGLHTVITQTDGSVNVSGYNSLGQLGKLKSKETFETVITVR